MELQRREEQILMLYALTSGISSKSEQNVGRKIINEDLSDLLEKGKLSKEEYDEMLKKLDEIDEEMKEV